jgi:hypothetical protein
MAGRAERRVQERRAGFHDNPHGIGGYLSDPVVARRIIEALA